MERVEKSSKEELVDCLSSVVCMNVSKRIGKEFHRGTSCALILHLFCHFEKKHGGKRIGKENQYHHKIDEIIHCSTHAYYHIENI